MLLFLFEKNKTKCIAINFFKIKAFMSLHINDFAPPRILLLIAFAILTFSKIARAVDTNWTGAISSDWCVNGNWDTGAVPTATDNALIGNNVLATFAGGAGCGGSVGNYATLTVGGMNTTSPYTGNLVITAGNLSGASVFAPNVQGGLATQFGSVTLSGGTLSLSGNYQLDGTTAAQANLIIDTGGALMGAITTSVSINGGTIQLNGGLMSVSNINGNESIDIGIDF